MDEKKLNHKVSHLVNKAYALAMIIETISLDLHIPIPYENACIMRSSVNMKNAAEQFGNWADSLETKILQVSGEKFEILVSCCLLLNYYSKRFEDIYRAFDPHFDFYQRNEVTAIYNWACKLEYNKELYSKISEIIKKEL